MVMEQGCDGYEYNLVMKILWVMPAAFMVPSLMFTMSLVLGLKSPTLRVLSIITFSLRVIFLYMVEIAGRLVDSFDGKLSLPSRDYYLALLSFSVLICYVLALRLPSKSLKQDVWASAILVASRVQSSFNVKSPFKWQNDVILFCMLGVFTVVVFRAYFVPLRRDSSFLQLNLRKGGEEEEYADTINNGCYGITQSDEDIDWLVKFRTVAITYSWLSASNRSRLNFVAHTSCLVASVVLVEAVVESLWFPEKFHFYYICSASGFLLTNLVVPFILIVNSILFGIVLIVWSVPFYSRWFKQRFNNLQLIEGLNRFTSHLKGKMIPEVVQMVLHRIYVEVSELVTRPKQSDDLPGNLFRLLGTKSSLGFQGVTRKVPSPNKQDDDEQEQLPTCWALHVFTLKSIAVGLPGISQDRLDGLLRSVSQGICYAALIDDVLELTEGPSPMLSNMVEATLLIGLPILIRPFGGSILRSQRRFARRFRYTPTCRRWLGANLRRYLEGTTTGKEALEKLRELAESKFTASDQTNESSNYKMSPNLNLKNLFQWSPQDFAAYSMYSKCQYFLDLENRGSELTAEAIFVEIEGTIADIFGYCITRYPRLVKCSSSYSTDYFANERIIKGVTSVLARSSKLRDLVWFMQMPPRIDNLAMDTAVQGSVVYANGDGGGPSYSSENTSSPDDEELGLEIDIDETADDDDSGGGGNGDAIDISINVSVS